MVRTKGDGAVTKGNLKTIINSYIDRDRIIMNSSSGKDWS